MLEPLIVLTVLNCFFMFSSTVTTCALWWQYRNHRCCARTIPSRQASRSHMRKSKSCSSCHVSKKIPPSQSKIDNTNHVFGTSRSFTNADEQYKRKYSDERKPKSKLRYLSEYKKRNGKKTYPLSECIKNKDSTIRRKVSQVSQTTNDTKSTVVMEFSTVQKIVQLVDNNGDISKARVTIIPAQDMVEKNKTFELDCVDKFDEDVIKPVYKISCSKMH